MGLCLGCPMSPAPGRPGENPGHEGTSRGGVTREDRKARGQAWESSQPRRAVWLTQRHHVPPALPGPHLRPPSTGVQRRSQQHIPQRLERWEEPAPPRPPITGPARGPAARGALPAVEGNRALALAAMRTTRDPRGRDAAAEQTQRPALSAALSRRCRGHRKSVGAARGWGRGRGAA